MFERIHSRRGFLSSASLCLLGLSAVTFAAEPSKDTTITITGLHCAGCAKKVKAKLAAVAHVKSADVDHKSGLATVTTFEAKTASPRALWEAVEAADAKPTKLVGPNGTFTSKPSS